MIYKGLNRTGEIETVKAHGGYDVAEVYGSINYQNPIFYSRKTLVGTSPLTFKGLGQPLKDYHIFGETVQDGTPSPDYPVDVQGVGKYDYVSGKYYIPISGDTTELCDIHDIDRGTLRCGIASIGYHVSTSYLVNVSTQTSTPNVILIPVKSATTYQVKFKTNNTVLRYSDFIRVAFINELAEGAGAYDIYTWQRTDNGDKLRNGKEYYVTMTNTNHRYLVVQSNLSPFSLFDYFSIQEVLSVTDIGSDPLYRIGDYADEIGSDGTLTRRNDIIDILADTSKLSYVGWFRKNTSYEYRCFRFQRITGVRKGASNCFRTYNTYYDGLRGPGEVTFLYADAYFAINFSVPPYIDTVEKCVQWLTDIYESTGKKPVFVCPISTPTTEQATAQSLPTLVGDNTLSVGTTVKPSAVSITGHIKPTGYGQLLDVNDVDIQDSTGDPIFIQG